MNILNSTLVRLFFRLTVSFQLFSIGCTHTNAKRIDKESEGALNKKMELLPKEEDASLQSTTPKESPSNLNESAPTEENLRDFLSRIKVENYSWIDSDDQLISSIQETPKNSLSEAALIMGLCFKSQKSQSTQKKNPTDSFQEEDIASNTQIPPNRNTTIPSDNLPPASMPYFDNLIHQHNIDLNAAIRENPFIKEDVLRRILRLTIMDHSFSMAFKDEHLASLSITQTDSSSEIKAPSDASTISHTISGEISFANLQNNDDKIALAQSYALEKNFEKAIEVIVSIQAPELRETSTELLRVYSNQGVNLLRQKAALSFQEALSAGNSNIKKSHLENAKSWLQQALEKYPNSDQSKVIQENLDIVSRDLANLGQ